MELEELITAWKTQDKYIDQQLKSLTFNHLLVQKSKGVLSQMMKKLTIELIIIALVCIAFNVLFFIIDLPDSILRWVCLAIFNLIALSIIIKYLQIINLTNINWQQNVKTTLTHIIKSLNRFRTQNKQFNIPISIVCIIMFAGAQNLLYWLPWLLFEFFLWRWVFLPKMEIRFEGYITDLEYLSNKLEELNE